MAKDLVQIIPDYSEKVGNMNAKTLAARDAESSGYAHYMAQMLEASEYQREENRKLAEIRFKRHGIRADAQQPSTQAILARPKEKDLEHFLRPLVDCQVRDKDGNIDVGERPVTREEVSHVEAIRRRPKNSIGQSEKSGSGEERKEAAVNAFICSPPAELTAMQKAAMSTIIPYQEEPMVVAEPTKTVEVPESPFGWLYNIKTKLLYWWDSR